MRLEVPLVARQVYTVILYNAYILLVWPARPLPPLQTIILSFIVEGKTINLSIMNRRGGMGLAGQTNLFKIILP